MEEELSSAYQVKVWIPVDWTSPGFQFRLSRFFLHFTCLIFNLNNKEVVTGAECGHHELPYEFFNYCGTVRLVFFFILLLFWHVQPQFEPFIWYYDSVIEPRKEENATSVNWHYNLLRGKEKTTEYWSGDSLAYGLQ